MLLGIFPRKVLFFPDNIPNQVITYIEYPQGTDIAKTNKATPASKANINIGNSSNKSLN
jgi:hypothetical protein